MVESFSMGYVSRAWGLGETNEDVQYICDYINYGFGPDGAGSFRI